MLLGDAATDAMVWGSSQKTDGVPDQPLPQADIACDSSDGTHDTPVPTEIRVNAPQAPMLEDEASISTTQISALQGPVLAQSVTEPWASQNLTPREGGQKISDPPEADDDSLVEVPEAWGTIMTWLS